MRKLETISECITLGAFINLVANMLLVTLFKFGIILWEFDAELLSIGAVMIVYSFVVLFAAIYTSSAINKVIKERRKELKEKELKKAS